MRILTKFDGEDQSSNGMGRKQSHSVGMNHKHRFRMDQNHKTRREFALSSIALAALGLSSIAAVLAAEAPSPTPAEIKKPVNIYLLSGQSNMTNPLFPRLRSGHLLFQRPSIHEPRLPLPTPQNASGLPRRTARAGGDFRRGASRFSPGVARAGCHDGILHPPGGPSQTRPLRGGPVHRAVRFLPDDAGGEG